MHNFLEYVTWKKSLKLICSVGKWDEKLWIFFGISMANEDGSEFSTVGADLNIYLYSSDYLLIPCISIENEDWQNFSTDSADLKCNLSGS
jgi:hypothetical protein